MKIIADKDEFSLLENLLHYIPEMIGINDYESAGMWYKIPYRFSKDKEFKFWDGKLKIRYFVGNKYIEFSGKEFNIILEQKFISNNTIEINIRKEFKI